MSRLFEVRLPLDEAYTRNALFALRVLDGVTLAPVSQGLRVFADGLQGKPIVNASGLFVWLGKDIGRLRKITIDPGILPYDSYELKPGDLQQPLPQVTTLQLKPRIDYSFASGITGLRGRLLEERVVPRQPARPVAKGEVLLEWLDEDGVTWRDGAVPSKTDSNGDFAAIVRLTPTDAPRLNEHSELTVRLLAQRPALPAPNERSSADVALLQGRIADQSTLAKRRHEGPSEYAKRREALNFAWDELQPWVSQERRAMP